MFKSAVIVGSAVISGLAAAGGVAALDRLDEARPVATVAKAADGHFWAEAEVEGGAVRVLVDTGATNVALTLADARRLGLDVASLDFSRPVRTAAGETRAAEVMLQSVSVAGARVEQVKALVLEEGLETSLLGMSYLGRLSRIEATPQALVLRP